LTGEKVTAEDDDEFDDDGVLEEEGEAGRDVEEMLILSVIIRLENVLRLPTKMLSPSTK